MKFLKSIMFMLFIGLPFSAAQAAPNLNDVTIDVVPANGLGDVEHEIELPDNADIQGRDSDREDHKGTGVSSTKTSNDSRDNEVEHEIDKGDSRDDAQDDAKDNAKDDAKDNAKDDAKDNAKDDAKDNAKDNSDSKSE